MATFSLVMPAFNEEKTIDRILDVLLRQAGVNEIVVVNDGSLDQTGEVLRRRLDSGEPRLRVVTHDVNRGKGAAIRSGLVAATSDYVAIQDADAEYDPSDLSRIFAELEKGTADVVFGSRFLRFNPTLYRTYLIGNKALTTLVNVIGGGRLTDAYTCYKAMSLRRWRDLDLQSDGFEVEAEISMKCLLAGWKVTEVPIGYRPRSFSEGKKIRGRDAVKGVLTILRFGLLRPRIGQR